MQPRPPQTNEQRERILSEAARLFVSQGYDGISMREIAEACGLSKAGIYYHFKDKQDLFLALMRANLERVAQLVAAARATGASQRAQVETFARGLFSQLDADQRALIRLANQELGKFPPQVRAEFGRDYFELFIGPLGEILAAGIQSGELRPIDPHTATWVLLGMLYPLFAPRGETTPEDSAAAAELALQIFFDGINKR